jgi:hypothetical protein
MTDLINKFDEMFGADSAQPSDSDPLAKFDAMYGAEPMQPKAAVDKSAIDQFDKLAGNPDYQSPAYRVADKLTSVAPNSVASLDAAMRIPPEQQEEFLDAVYELGGKKKSYSSQGVAGKTLDRLMRGMADLTSTVGRIGNAEGATDEQRKFARQVMAVWEKADPVRDPGAAWYSPKESLGNAIEMVPSLMAANAAGSLVGMGAKAVGAGKGIAGAAENISGAATFAPGMYQATYDELIDKGVAPSTARWAAASSAALQSALFVGFQKKLMPKGWSEQAVRGQLADGFVKHYIKTAGIHGPSAMAGGKAIDEAIKDFAMGQDPDVRKYIYTAADTYLKSLGPNAVVGLPGSLTRIGQGGEQGNVTTGTIKQERVNQEIINAARSGETPTRAQWKDWGLKKPPAKQFSETYRRDEVRRLADELMGQQAPQDPNAAPAAPENFEQPPAEVAPPEAAPSIIDNPTKPEIEAAVEQAKVEQAAPPTEPPPAGQLPADIPPATSIKNQGVNDLRPSRGDEPLVSNPTGDGAFQKYLDEAKSRVQQEPSYAENVMAAAKKTGMALNGVQTAAVQLQYRQLNNDYAIAADRLVEAQKSGNEIEIDAARASADSIRKKLDEVERDYRRFGSTASEALNARRIELAKDYSLANLLRRAVVAKNGESVTPEEHAKIKEMAAKIAELQKKLDAKEVAASAPKEKRGFVKQSTKVAQAKKAVDSAWEEFNQLRESFKKTATGESGALNVDLLASGVRLAKAYAKMGVATVEDFLSKAKENLKEGFDEHKDTLIAAWMQHTQGKRAEGLDRDIRKLEEELRTGNLKVPSKLPEDTVGIRIKKERLAELRRQKRDLLNPEDERIDAKAKSLDESIQKVTMFLTGVEAKKAEGSWVGITPEVEAKKAELDKLLEEKKALVKSRKLSEEDKYKNSLRKKLEGIQEDKELVEQGFFPPEKPVKKRVLDKEATDLKFQIKEEQLKFKALEEGLKYQKMTPLQKTGKMVPEVFNATRAIMTSYDMSAILRQGGWVAYGHPSIGVKSQKSAVKSMLSKKGEFETMEEIRSRPNAPRYDKSGLALTVTEGRLSSQEEAYMGSILHKIPELAKKFGLAGKPIAWAAEGVNASERAYVATLNDLRANLFDVMTADLQRGGWLRKSGEATAYEDRIIANYVNAATGRGDFGKYSGAADALATYFFSPRYLLSRFQLISGQPMWRGTARTRLLIAKEYAKTLIGMTAFYGSIAAYGAAYAQITGDKKNRPVFEFDPRSADFGKVRFGDLRVDPLSGLSQVTVFSARNITGQAKASTGETVALRNVWNFGAGKVKFGSMTMPDVWTRFLRSKLAPIQGTIIDTVSGANVVGEELSPGQAVLRNVTPLSFRDIYEAMKSEGVDKKVALSTLVIFGMGIQNYSNAKAEDFAFKISQHPELKGMNKDTKEKFDYRRDVSQIVAQAKKFGITQSQLSQAIEKDLKKRGYKQEAIIEWKRRLRSRYNGGQ